jgi:hypothetical protein
MGITGKSASESIFWIGGDLRDVRFRSCANLEGVFMNSTGPGRSPLPAIVFGLIIFGGIGLLLIAGERWGHDGRQHGRQHRKATTKMEMTELVVALERVRVELGNGQYPPASTEDPDAVTQFLATAFPRYHDGLPEKYKNLDAASSLVFWLGGTIDKDGKMIGFSAAPTSPFDTTSKERIGPFFDFDRKQLRVDNGLPIYLPSGADPQSEPYVYFCADSKGEYHGAWSNCRPCRDSNAGGWINPKSFQLFAPGLDGKYGCGVQYPSGADYDQQRKDDMSNFTMGPTLGDDMP